MYLPIFHFLMIKVRTTLANIDPTMVNDWSAENGSAVPYSESTVYKTGIICCQLLGFFFNFYIVAWITGSTGVISRYNQNMLYNVLDTLTKVILSQTLSVLWPIYIIAVGPTGNEDQNGNPTSGGALLGVSTKVIGSDETDNPEADALRKRLEKSGSHLTKTYDPVSKRVTSYNHSLTDHRKEKRFFQKVDKKMLARNNASTGLNSEFAHAILGKKLYNGMFHIATHPEVAAKVLPGIWRGVRNPKQDIAEMSDFHEPNNAGISNTTGLLGP